ncbi:MAG: alpha-L-fucosidase [Mycobacteriaceae bacterium]
MFAAVVLGAVQVAPSPDQRPRRESVGRHPLPDWYDDAKLGIFLHWGLAPVRLVLVRFASRRVDLVRLASVPREPTGNRPPCQPRSSGR